MLTIEIDDSQVQHFIKVSPRRAEWAFKEALLATGGHLRKKIKAFIEKGGAGWPPLSPATIKMKREHYGAGKFRTKPLEVFMRLVRFRVGKSKGRPVMTVGFFNTKDWFKRYYGIGTATIAKLHERGRRRPLRPMIGPVWQKERSKIPGYIERKFFANFFSSKNSRLKI